MSRIPPAPDLSSDRPISSLSEDLLGRGGFAVALANAFIEWKGKDSLVVALYGPWGSGKSSVKNMVLELIRRHGDDPAIVEFNPWAWSGRDRIFGAFFEEVGIAIGKGSDKEQSKALAARWKKYGARLSFAGIAVNAIKMGSQAVGIPVVPLILEGVSTAAKKSSELAEGAVKAYDATSEDEPLEELKKTLAEALGGLKAPLMVVLDDVDRLTKEEIRTLFQLIKANADFPKVVYFLLFDRGVIEKALEVEGGSTGREYLEKIVQVGFDLPRHDQADLDKMLFEGLERLLSFEGADHTFDAERWGKLLLFGLRPILDTPRDVNRFLSSLSFTVGLFYKEQTLEANVIDMIGVEALRVFEPHLHQQLSGRRDLLLGGREEQRAGREERESRGHRIEEFIGQASEAHQSGVRAILRELFPSVDWLLKGQGEGSGFEAGWMRSLRICHPQLFDRYFALAVPKGDLPASTIQRIIAAIKDRRELGRELSALGEAGRLLDALRRLASYVPELDMGGAESFVTAVMDVGDSLPTKGTRLYDVWPDLAAYFLIREFLMREADIEARSRIVLGALSATDGLHAPLQIVCLDRHHQEKHDSLQTSLLDERSWKRAKKICLAKIKARADDGRLRGPKLGSILGRWRELDGDEGPRKYIAKLTTTLEGCLQFLRASAGEVRGQAEGGVTVQIQTTIDLGAIERFVPTARIKSNLGPLLVEDVPDEVAGLATEYHKELAAFRAALTSPRQAHYDLLFGGEEGSLLDLNSATPSELADLPGIGEGLANRIIENRPFGRIDDLKKVNGIGERKLAQLRKLIRV